MLNIKKIAVVAVACAVVASSIPLRASAYTELPIELNEYADWCAGKFDLPSEVVKAVIYVESTNNPKAVNGNCVGLMQVNKHSKIEFNGEPAITIDTDLYQPYDAIYSGCICLAYYLSVSDTMHEALNKYNGLKTEKPSGYSNKVLALAYEIEKGWW